MKLRFFLLIILISLSSCKNSTGPVILHNKQSLLPVWDAEYRTTKVQSYSSNGVAEEPEIQCPIPMKDRVANYTGIQCVYSSIETIGRWAECQALITPPLTSRPDCKSFSGPNQAAAKLNELGVRFEQSYHGQSNGIALIKKAMLEGRGCLFGIPGHAMVLVHYDEEKDVVKWIDNSDRNLRVQTMTVNRFKSTWNEWVLVIYAQPDVVQFKLNRISTPNKIPIIDRNNPQGTYPKNYVPTPSK